MTDIVDRLRDIEQCIDACDDAADELDRLRSALAQAQARSEAAERELAALRAMLERAQYGRDHRCPICGEYEREMHAVECELRNLLYGGKE